MSLKIFHWFLLIAVQRQCLLSYNKNSETFLQDHELPKHKELFKCSQILAYRYTNHKLLPNKCFNGWNATWTKEKLNTYHLKPLWALKVEQTLQLNIQTALNQIQKIPWGKKIWSKEVLNLITYRITDIFIKILVSFTDVWKSNVKKIN